MRRLAVSIALLVCGCAAGPETDPERPFVLGSARQLGDLYWSGELTDSRGNRWNVKILPGVAPTFRDAGEAWVDAWDFGGELVERDFWADRGTDVVDGLEFAGDDVLDEFLVEGIVEGYSDTTAAIEANVRETPFGWIPRIVARATWGYVLEPLGRIVLAPIGAAGGVGYSVVTPTLHVVARPVGAVLYGTVVGVAWPAGKLAFHQPAWLLSIVNREPAERHHGTFGLWIIRRADGSVPPPPGSPSPPTFAQHLATERHALIDAVHEDEVRRADDRAVAQHDAPDLPAAATGDEALRARWEALRAEIDPDGVTGERYDYDAVVRRWREQRDGLRRVD